MVNSTCGHETARFTKSFLDRMSGPLIQGHCQEHGSAAACIDLMAVEEGHHPVANSNSNHMNHMNHHNNHNNNEGVDPWRTPDSYPYSADVSKASVNVAAASVVLAVSIALAAVF